MTLRKYSSNTWTQFTLKFIKHSLKHLCHEHEINNYVYMCKGGRTIYVNDSQLIGSTITIQKEIVYLLLNTYLILIT